MRVSISPAPLDLRLSDRTVIQPDIMVVRKDVRYGRDVVEIPVLAVEVLSPTSRRNDLVRKPEILAHAGCPHYGVVDPAEQLITALDRQGEAYREAARAQGEEALAVDRQFPLQVSPAALLR